MPAHCSFAKFCARPQAKARALLKIGCCYMKFEVPSTQKFVLPGPMIIDGLLPSACILGVKFALPGIFCIVCILRFCARHTVEVSALLHKSAGSMKFEAFCVEKFGKPGHRGEDCWCMHPVVEICYARYPKHCLLALFTC